MIQNDEEKRVTYQIESTNQAATLNEIYMTWRYAPNQAILHAYVRPSVHAG